MHSETFVRPPTTKPAKSPYEMTLEELKTAADEQALEFYCNKTNADPTNEAARGEYQNYCLTHGIDPATGKISRFATMSREEIAAEWVAKGRQEEEAELEQWRYRQAKTWLASRAEYNPTPQNADLLINECKRLGLQGDVYELDQAFWSLVRQRMILPKEIIEPVALPTKAELYDMPLHELKRLAEETNR